MPSDCILMVSTPCGSPVMTLQNSMMAEINSISFNCYSRRGPLVAIPIRGGDLGHSGLASNPGESFMLCAFGGVGVAVPSLVEVVLTTHGFSPLQHI